MSIRTITHNSALIVSCRYEANIILHPTYTQSPSISMVQFLGWIEISRRVGACWRTPLRSPRSYLLPASAGGLLCSVFTVIVGPHRRPHTSYTRYVSSVIATRRYCNIQLFESLGEHVSLPLSVNLRGSDLPQLQEGRGELVSDETAGVWVTVLSASCYRIDRDNSSVLSFPHAKFSLLSHSIQGCRNKCL